MSSPNVRRMNSDKLSTRLLTLIGVGASGWRRANANRRWVNAVARRAPPMALAMARRT